MTGDGRSNYGTPRWVKALAAIGLVLVLLVAIVLVVGGGNHGPARHIPAGRVYDEAPPASRTATVPVSTPSA